MSEESTITSLKRLISIWGKLTLTSLDVIHYTMRLQFQRLKFTIRDWKAINKSVSQHIADTPHMHFGTPPEKPKNKVFFFFLYLFSIQNESGI